MKLRLAIELCFPGQNGVRLMYRPIPGKDQDDPRSDAKEREVGEELARRCLGVPWRMIFCLNTLGT